MDSFEKYSFASDSDMSEFNRVFGISRIKEIHADVYLSEPYMLLSRIIDKNVVSSFNNGMFTLKRKDKTHVVNILLEDIENCAVKRYSDYNYQIIFTIHNVSYKILIVI